MQGKWRLVRRRPTAYVLLGPGGQASLGSTTTTGDEPAIVPAENPYGGAPVFNIGGAGQVALVPTVGQPSATSAAQPNAVAQTTLLQLPVAISSPRPTSTIMAPQAASRAASPTLLPPNTVLPEPSPPVEVVTTMTTDVQAATASPTAPSVPTAATGSSAPSGTGLSAKLAASATSTSRIASSTAASDTSNTSNYHNIPIILGIIVACIVGFAALAASVSFILRMRRKDRTGGICGCFGGRPPPEEGIEKWVYDEPYDIEKSMVMDSDCERATMKNDCGAGWSRTTASSLGTYPATPHPMAHPAALYAGSPVSPYHHYQPHLSFANPLDRPLAAHVNSSYDPYLQRPSVDHDASPVQHAPTPGQLTIANFAPGDISDGTSRPTTQSGLQSPWMAQTPDLSIPQRPWTASFTPYNNPLGTSPVLPLPEGFGTPRHETEPRYVGIQGQELTLPWAPLKVRTKSHSKDGSGPDSRKSSMRSAYSDAPRLPSPPTMHDAGFSEHVDGGWASSLKSNIFAYLGTTVSNMGTALSTSGGRNLSNDKLTPAMPRVTSSRSSRVNRKVKDWEIRRGDRDGSHVMAPAAEASYVQTHQLPSSSLYTNVQEESAQHNSTMRKIGRSQVKSMHPARSVSVYSSTTGGYTTDRGLEAEEEYNVASLGQEQLDIVRMYALPSEDGVGRMISRRSRRRKA